MNRDIIALKRVIFAMQDVCCAEERAQWEREHLFSVSPAPISDMPRGGSVKKGLDEGIARLCERTEAHKSASDQYREELQNAEEILNRIENPNLRTFVMMVYVMNLSDEETEKRLDMSKYALRQVKSAIERAERMDEVEIPKCFA